MNICIATDLFPPEGGGSERSAYFLAKGLAKRGHNILVVMPHFGQKTTYEKRKWFKIIRFRYLRASNVAFFRNVAQNELLYLYMSQMLKKTIKNYKIELVHAQNILTVPPSIIAARKTKIPVIAHIRDYWPICFRRSFMRPNGSVCNGCNSKNLINCIRLEGLLSSFFMPASIPYVFANMGLKQLLLNRADHIIAISEAVRTLLLTRPPIAMLKYFSRLSPQKISVIPNIMPVPSKTLTQSELLTMRHSYNFDENDILILYVGQLTYGKGVLTLIQATKHLLQKNPSVKLIILGTGPLADHIKEINSDIGEQLRYYGFFSYDKVLKFYQMADIVVVPSIWPEALGRVNLEAMALGRPVIATNVGGIPEIITHEKDGILVKPGDPKEIECALYRLITDPDLRFHIGLEGRKTIEQRYNETIICNQTHNLYKKLTALRL
ncbi:MAG: glycosyltransferase family 4 protein [Promethearchaeota archaeon]